MGETVRSLAAGKGRLKGEVSARFAPASALLMGVFVLLLYWMTKDWPAANELVVMREFLRDPLGWAVVFDLPRPGPWWQAIALHSDAQQAGPAGARAWMLTLRYWVIILLSLPLPLLWLRANKRRRA